MLSVTRLTLCAFAPSVHIRNGHRVSKSFGQNDWHDADVLPLPTKERAESTEQGRTGWV